MNKLKGGVMDIQKERELFLAHMRSIGSAGFMFELNEDGNFDDMSMSYAWSAWQAAKAQAVPRWISVKNAMPKAGSQVLTYDDYGFVSVENIDGCEDPNNVYFSHWLPLPPVEQEPAND